MSDKSVPHTDAKETFLYDKLICLTWNIEGYSRNCFELRQILDSSVSPDLIFLSESKLFQPDVKLSTALLSPDYEFFLNSEDLYEPGLPLVANQAHGGTLTAWKSCLDPYISVLNTKSSRILPILLEIPNSQPTIHINIYLPTTGLDKQYIDELANLQNTIEDVSEQYPTALVYVRGDANASYVVRNANKRDGIFKYFCEENLLKPTLMEHKTYHHFMGGGQSDSSIDVLLTSSMSHDGTPALESETVLEILCSKSDPRISNSHHDAIISSFKNTFLESSTIDDNFDVPTIENTRHKIIWNPEALQNYSDLVSPVLTQLRDTWLNASSPSSISILLQQTNNILSSAAKSTQKVIELGSHPKPKKPRIPPAVKTAQKSLKRTKDVLAEVKINHNNTEELKDAECLVASAKADLQRAKRSVALDDELERDSNLFSILTNDPARLYSSIRRNKRQSVMINKLTVGKETFTGDNVKKGFYKSVSQLKTRDPALATSKTFQEFVGSHNHILEISKSGKTIPLLSWETAKNLLKSIKPSVTDLHSISALHYINGGDDVILHFQHIINAVLSDVENYVLDEINRVYAIILHKGHGKDKSSDRSYRTISSCPFIAKCADKYIGGLSMEDWSAVQAETQFQQKGLSHEHSALLLTEAVNYSVKVNKLPVFCLLLDAKSAFDRALREVLTTRMYLDGTDGQSLLYLDSRLANRTTVVEWDKCLMGPINDEQGTEQGGTNSSEQYKLYNNEQFNVAQQSCFGVDIGPISVSSVGQADDSALLSSCFSNLNHLLKLTLNYCEKYQVIMTPEKTKLLVFSPDSNDTYVDYFKQCNYLEINDVPITFVDTAEHVGIVRATSGNLPHVLHRIASHKRSLGAVLSAGLARRHRGNPAASLHVEKIYSLPVLLSGVAALCLLESEIDIMSHHYKETLQGLLKLHQATPGPFVFFLGGSLPFRGHLHIRQITLFLMITQLPENILNRVASHILTTAPDSSTSWFNVIRKLCYQYHLPHPLLLLRYPPEMILFKKTVKLNVIDFWRQKLTSEAAPLDSLLYFKPEYMSLEAPHVLWTSCNSNPYEVQKAVIQSRMLSGRYRDDRLARHFTSNTSGSCLLCQENGEANPPTGDLPHILLQCPSLASRRSLLAEYWVSLTKNCQVARKVITEFQTKPTEYQMQFLLDCSVIPTIIAETQHHDGVLNLLFRLTRTFCYAVHRERLKKLNRWC